VNIEPSLILAIGLPAAGALVWLIRLEGRINLNEQRTNDLHADLSEIKADVKTLIRMNGKRFSDTD
jgi:hypothetical protein